MRPGDTIRVALGTGYQRLATLAGQSGDKILTSDGTETANQALLSITTQAAVIAFGESMPIISGHPLEAGDSYTLGNQEFIRKAWLRGVSGSILIITPIYE